MARRLVYRLEMLRAMRRERVFRDRIQPFDVYDDFEMYERFRFRREYLIELVNMLQDDLEHPLPRLGSLTPIMQVMIAVRFYATGSFQQVTGDLFGVSKCTVSRVLRRVSAALSRRIGQFVQLPDQQTADRMMEQFFDMCGFPMVIGCIDGTHINIIAPTANEFEYINRKGKHSINVQLICDADLLIINCVVRWPGSVHDARILRESNLFRNFSLQRKPLRGVFLGDSGYMLREWLMTPFLNPESPAQQRYNAAHASTRSTIERTIGVLKRRWHCLHTELRYQPANACHIIMACIVLHNIATTHGLPIPEAADALNEAENNEPGENFINGGAHERDAALAGRWAREELVRQIFAR